MNNQLSVLNAAQSTAEIFDALEMLNNFRAGLDLSRAAIELSDAVNANDNISAEKARLTMLNRVNRTKRFVKINKLSDVQLSIIAANSTPDKIESTAIYAVDKVIQASRFLSGESEIFGRGKNNTLLYLLRGIAVHAPQIITREFAVNTLTRYGQPHESADTQASSSCKALLALDCLVMIAPGRYIVNANSKLMSLMLSNCGAK